MIQRSAASTNRTFGIGYPHNQFQLEATVNNFKSPTASMFNRHEKRARSIVINEMQHNQLYKVKGGSPGGVFLYDSSRKSQVEDENQTNIVDFIKRNLNIGKQQKNMDFERHKELINKVYNKIKKRKDYGLDVKNLFNIQSCLNPKLKHHYLSNQGFFQIFTEANVLNQTFLQIIDQVSCYRVELGILLQKLVESYNSIILQQFEEFYRSENLKEKELSVKLAAQQQSTEELFQRRMEFEKKLESVQALIQGKDAQIASLMQEQESLEKENKYLRELLELDSGKKMTNNLVQNLDVEPNVLNARDEKIKVLNRRESSITSGKIQADKTQAKEEFTNNIEDLNVKIHKINNFQEVLKNLENEQNEKKNILAGMDRLLRTMMKSNTSHYKLNFSYKGVGFNLSRGWRIVLETLELYWRKHEQPQSKQINKHTKKTKQLLFQIKTIDLDSSRRLTSQEQSQKPSQNYQQLSSKGQFISPNSQIDLEPIDEQKEHKLAQNLTYSTPMDDYGSAQKILQMKEEDRIAELENRLNQMVVQSKNPDQLGDKQGESTSVWTIPSHILVFIANSIEDNQTGRVLPWPEFKLVIYDIYDHRIQNASEVNGVINTTYLCFEEYVLIYFLDRFKLRRLAELKIIETLTSLKYYVDIWPRAKSFAQLMNIVKPSKSQNQSASRKTQQQSYALIELSMPNIDIYFQEFFLYAYSMLQQDKDHFIESKDGITYVRVTHEEIITTTLMNWFNDQDSRKWFHKVRRNVKKIKTNPLDDFETDYIDTDVLLNMYCEEYKTKRKQNQKNLSKEFMRRYQEQEGLFNSEEIDKIVATCTPSQSPSVYVKYPGIISVRRAFLYALVCGENGFEISTQEFIAGCNRFGIDNPCPTVTKRISLFGNDEDFDELIKKELIKSSVQQQSKVHTTKQIKGNIKIETSRISTSNLRQNEPASSNLSGQKNIVTGIQNLKLLGRIQTAGLDPNGGDSILAGGVKLNIGQLGKDLAGDSQTNGQKKGTFTQEETSIGNKKIIIPSFSTTSALFSQHFSILRDLKKRIEGLKQAYYSQREEERSWEQVEKILHVLEAACKFLDFPIQS
ncbi:UNKNOWN [Stylonychia lemnae]|uniref:Uncharacterized protein n=1 Tax=Stylonychia lemnae TaxID=5949 RepID=A0A078AH45_STYLE|nr:UNKNOWN [Stylonychia lemnae]|eukprot:CDW81151.1 UNKNOWN [Stylonychia lemnae]